MKQMENKATKKQKKNKAIGSSVKGKKGHINPPSDLCGLLTVSERNRNASVAYLSCRIHLCCYTSKSFGIKLKRKRKRTVQSNKQPSSLPFSPCLNQTGVNCWFFAGLKGQFCPDFLKNKRCKRKLGSCPLWPLMCSSC